MGLTLPFHWNREGGKKKGWWFSCKLCNVVSYAEYWFIAGIHKPKPPCWDRIIGDVIITTSLYHGVITHCCTADCSCRSSVLCLATTIIPFCSKSFFFFFLLNWKVDSCAYDGNLKNKAKQISCILFVIHFQILCLMGAHKTNKHAVITFNFMGCINLFKLKRWSVLYSLSGMINLHL